MPFRVVYSTQHATPASQLGLGAAASATTERTRLDVIAAIIATKSRCPFVGGHAATVSAMFWGRHLSWLCYENAAHQLNQTVNDGVAHSKNPKKCAYHVTFDLDLERTLDACLPGDQRVQVWWRSSQLSARRSDLHKSLQTDRRTDDGRLAIALAHSWNELKCRKRRK